MYGCGEPGTTESVWNCGEMAKKDNDTELTAGTCKGGTYSTVNTNLN